MPALGKSSTHGILKTTYDKNNLTSPEDNPKENRPKLSAYRMKSEKKPKIKAKKKKEEKNPYETTDESEDPLHEQIKHKPRLRAYDKNIDGKLLYAFLELRKWDKPILKTPEKVQKSESYNPAESNFQAYKRTIINTGITGVSRQYSETLAPKVASPSTLSKEDYSKILELKNRRMKTLLGRK